MAVLDYSKNKLAVTVSGTARSNQPPVTPGAPIGRAGSLTRSGPRPTGDPFFNNVVLLTNFNGVDGATTANDDSNSHHTLTFNGNAQLDTGILTPWGDASLLLDGTGDWVSAGDSADWVYSGQFTLEGWAYIQTLGTRLIFGQSAESSQRSFRLYFQDSGGAQQFFVNFWVTDVSGATHVLTSGDLNITAGKWFHWAITRDASNTMRLFIDGVMRASKASASGTNFNSSSDLRIGGQENNSGTWLGNLAEMRITSGVCRYGDDAGFDPPGAAFPRTVAAGITSVSPVTGGTAGGNPVTVTGTTLTGATDVKFNGVSATSVVVVNSTTVTCNAPAGAAGVVDVQIFTPSGNPTLTNGYTYAAASLTSCSPSSGSLAGGTPVTLTGVGLTGTTDVQFDGVSATSIVVVSDTSVTCVTPAGSTGPADVQAFTPSGNPTLAAGYTYLDVADRVTQAPLIVVDVPPQKSRVTQAPVIVLYLPEEPTRVTQAPVLVFFEPKPVPLPTPVVPEVPVTESWVWKTTISEAINSQEQRRRLREVPRYKMQFNVLILNEPDRVHIYNMLMRYLKTPFLYPMYQYSVKLTQASLTGSSKLFCDTTKTDVRAGESVALFNPSLETTVYLTISTVDVDGVNLSSPLTFDVGAHFHVCPAISFRIASGSGLSMRNIDGVMSLMMESVNPRVFQRPGAAPTLATIDGILIIPEKFLENDEVPETFINGAEWFDNDTSVPEILNEWSNPHVASTRRYSFDRATKMDYWRAICDPMKGKQGVALFPTFHDDLPLRDPMVLNSVTFTTSNVDFFIWYLETNYRYLAISTANGMKYRKVTAVDPHYNLNGDPDYLTVTLASSTGNTAGDNVIAAVSYMNLCRFDSDEVKLTHYEVDTEIEFPIRAENK